LEDESGLESEGKRFAALTNELIEKEETSNDEEEPTICDPAFSRWLFCQPGRGRAKPESPAVSDIR